MQNIILKRLSYEICRIPFEHCYMVSAVSDRILEAAAFYILFVKVPQSDGKKNYRFSMVM
jgi:hypothetical protein